VIWRAERQGRQEALGRADHGLRDVELVFSLRHGAAHREELPGCRLSHREGERAIDIVVIRALTRLREHLHAARDVRASRRPVHAVSRLDLALQEPPPEERHRRRRERHLKLPSEIEKILLEERDGSPEDLAIGAVVLDQLRQRRVAVVRLDLFARGSFVWVQAALLDPHHLLADLAEWRAEEPVRIEEVPAIFPLLDLHDDRRRARELRIDLVFLASMLKDVVEDELDIVEPASVRVVPLASPIGRECVVEERAHVGEGPIALPVVSADATDL